MTKAIASLAPALSLNCRKVLVINAALSSDQTSALWSGTTVRRAGFDAVTAALLKSEAPDCILAPLVIDSLDILDIAERLSGLGYAGLLLAVAPPLPNPNLIRAEMRSLFPAIQFDLIEAPEIGKPDRRATDKGASDKGAPEKGAPDNRASENTSPPGR